MVTVIEHEAEFIAVSVVVERGDFYSAARFAVIDVVDHFIAGIEINQIDVVGGLHTANEIQEGAIIFATASDIAIAMHHPSDVGVGIRLAKLLNTPACWTNEVSPPAIVTQSFCSQVCAVLLAGVMNPKRAKRARLSVRYKRPRFMVFRLGMVLTCKV